MDDTVSNELSSAVRRTPDGGKGSIVYLMLVCLVAALGGLLFGYDTGVISGAIGPLEVRFELDAKWVGWTASCALVGCMFGAGLAGTISDRIGRKKVLIISAVFFLVSALGTALPRNLTEFIIFRFIGGLGVGAASLTSPMYIAEISPARIRGRMVSVNQFAIVSGFLVVYFVNYLIGGYGAGIDRRAVAEHIAQDGTKLDIEAVTKFIARRGGEIDGKEVGVFLDEHGDSLDSQAVVDFMKEHKVEVKKLDVEVAGYGVASWVVQSAWRWMFGSESILAVMLLFLACFVPESPRWLTKQKREDEALGILSRVDGYEFAKTELAEIKEAITHESGSLAQLFQPGMKIVLAIAIVLAILQQVTGINAVLYYAPEIFKNIGYGTADALLRTVGMGVVNMSLTIVAIWAVDRLGRKPLMIIGSIGMGAALLVLGLAFFFEQRGYWVLVAVLAYIACFALSLGPVVWVVLSEIFPTRIRGRAMAIATVILWMACYTVSQTFPMMDKNQWLVEKFHHGFSFWVYGGFCVVTLLFVWLFVPETKGKTLEEIEKHWMRQ